MGPRRYRISISSLTGPGHVDETVLSAGEGNCRMDERIISDHVVLVCPRCRTSVNGVLVKNRIALKKTLVKEANEVIEGFLACTGKECGAVYPVIGGVPVVFRNMADWWSKGQSHHLDIGSLHPELREFLHGMSGDVPKSPEEDWLLASYLDSHFS